MNVLLGIRFECSTAAEGLPSKNGDLKDWSELMVIWEEEAYYGDGKHTEDPDTYKLKRIHKLIRVSGSFKDDFDDELVINKDEEHMKIVDDMAYVLSQMVENKYIHHKKDIPSVYEARVTDVWWSDSFKAGGCCEIMLKYLGELQRKGFAVDVNLEEKPKDDVSKEGIVAGSWVGPPKEFEVLKKRDAAVKPKVRWGL